MGSKSDAWEVDVLKMVTGQASSVITSTPITPFIALYTVAPTDSAAGTEVANAGAYARVTSAAKWAAPTSGAGSVANNAVITFPTATADWAAGGTQVVAFAIMTSGTYGGGTMLMWGTLTTPKNVLNGDTPSFASGALVLTED